MHTRYWKKGKEAVCRGQMGIPHVSCKLVQVSAMDRAEASIDAIGSSVTMLWNKWIQNM